MSNENDRNNDTLVKDVAYLWSCADRAAPTDNTALVEALLHLRGLYDCADVVDAALASREAPPACQQDAVTVAKAYEQFEKDQTVRQEGGNVYINATNKSSFMAGWEAALRALKGDQ